MEKFLGIRRLDGFGRITIPVDVRKDTFLSNIEEEKYILTKSETPSVGRKLDELFRIVISCDARKVLDIVKGDFIKIELGDSDEILLSKFVEGCVFCGKDGTNPVLGKNVCKSCIDKLKTIKINL